MIKKNKKRIIVILIVSFVTCFLFWFCRVLAIQERGNYAFGGEILFFLLPIIIELFYENIVLSKK